MYVWMNVLCITRYSRTWERDSQSFHVLQICIYRYPYLYTIHADMHIKIYMCGFLRIYARPYIHTYIHTHVCTYFQIPTQARQASHCGPRGLRPCPAHHNSCLVAGNVTLQGHPALAVIERMALCACMYVYMCIYVYTYIYTHTRYVRTHLVKYIHTLHVWIFVCMHGSGLKNGQWSVGCVTCTCEWV
jgi:hypothetical protein